MKQRELFHYASFWYNGLYASYHLFFYSVHMNHTNVGEIFDHQLLICKNRGKFSLLNKEKKCRMELPRAVWVDFVNLKCGGWSTRYSNLVPVQVVAVDWVLVRKLPLDDGTWPTLSILIWIWILFPSASCIWNGCWLRDGSRLLCDRIDLSSRSSSDEARFMLWCIRFVVLLLHCDSRKSIHLLIASHHVHPREIGFDGGHGLE